MVDSVRRESAEEAQRERDPGLGGEHRVARDEHEPQQVVADMVVERLGELGFGAFLPGLELVADLGVLAVHHGSAPHDVDRAPLADGHEPGARVIGHAGFRPLLEGCEQGVLCEIFGQPDVADDTGEAGNQLRGLDSPDRVDGAMGVGRRHGSQSHHDSRPVQVRWAEL